MTKIITFFNHKGGVGKTTQLYNLAWALSLKGKKVLMVDADSQCNLSSQALGEEGFEKHYISFPKDNLKEALSPAFEAKPELIKAIECPTIGDNLFLLPGSFDISQNETQLGVAINFNITFLTMTNLPGAFYNLIEKCAEKYNVDYVLIDLNPGLSAINQVLLFSSNYFVIPCGVDYFSKQALISLSKIILNWSNWNIKAKEYFKESTYPLPNFTTKFIGYTVNNYKVRSQKPAQAVKEVIEELDSVVKEKLVPSLKTNNNVIKLDTYKIAQTRDFNTLQQVSHQVNKPVFLLTKEDTKKSGNVAEIQGMNIDEFKETFDNFADFIIKNAI
jgi:chromosome partitioning protein